MERESILAVCVKGKKPSRSAAEPYQRSSDGMKCALSQHPDTYQHWKHGRRHLSHKAADAYWKEAGTRSNARGFGNQQRCQCQAKPQHDCASLSMSRYQRYPWTDHQHADEEYPKR
jgi:hypothetical protein